MKNIKIFKTIIHSVFISFLVLNFVSAETSNCFDYYRFGSVTADVSPVLSSVVSGAGIPFKVSLVNHNSYPVTEGVLYIRVFKETPNGSEVVDQYAVKKSVSLDASSTLPLEFVWNVPSTALSGEYRVATFFVTSEKYNLLGLTFTDDVVGNSAKFKVIGELTKNVRFDKNAAYINSKKYSFNVFPASVSSTTDAKVSVTVLNDTDEEQNIPVSFDLYQWDAQKK